MPLSFTSRGNMENLGSPVQMSSPELEGQECDYVSDMSQRCIGCLAKWRPITQHYVAMTKREAETSDPLHSRRAHPPASKLTTQCQWETTAPVRFSWLQIIQ